MCRPPTPHFQALSGPGCHHWQHWAAQALLDSQSKLCLLHRNTCASNCNSSSITHSSAKCDSCWQFRVHHLSLKLLQYQHQFRRLRCQLLIQLPDGRNHVDSLHGVDVQLRLQWITLHCRRCSITTLLQLHPFGENVQFSGRH